MLKRPWQVTAAIVLTLAFFLPLEALPAEAAQLHLQTTPRVETVSEPEAVLDAQEQG